MSLSDLSQTPSHNIFWSGSGTGAPCFGSEGFVGPRPRFELFAGWLTLFATEGWTGRMHIRPIIILPGVGQRRQRPTGEAKKLESVSYYVGDALRSVMRMGDTLQCSRGTSLNVHYNLVRDSASILSAGAVGSVDSGGPMAVWESPDAYRNEEVNEFMKKEPQISPSLDTLTKIRMHMEWNRRFREFGETHKVPVKARIHDQTLHLIDGQSLDVDPYFVFLARTSPRLLALGPNPLALHSAGRTDMLARELIIDAAEQLIASGIRIL